MLPALKKILLEMICDLIEVTRFICDKYVQLVTVKSEEVGYYVSYIIMTLIWPYQNMKNKAI